MRVLITASPIPDHLHNLVPLAWAARTAGHEVCVAGRPELAEVTKNSGLTSVSVPAGEGSSGIPDLSEGDPAALAAYVAAIDPVLVDGLVEYGRAWKPDLVLWDARSHAGALLARTVGAAHVRVLAEPDHLARFPDPGPLAARLAELAGDHEHGDDLLFGQATIDPLPEWLRVPSGLDRRPMRHVPHHGQTVIPSWLRRTPRRPRVCLVPGPDQPVAEVLGALADLNVEVIAELPADRVPAGVDLPDNVRIFDSLPLDPLLPSCAVIVHDGRISTLNAAVVHGVPQLVTGGSSWVTERLEEQSAGLAGTAGTLAGDLARLLDDPALRDGAERAQKEMLSAPSPHDIVPGLEKLAARR
ncbi:nucleotide disphospho-sugar-binding domain-containing protein [Actinomadura rudentiformis]|uniref:DUF1205 domain-containing protein n=1 Tax=Actinomadura rudentiformis TaxID=359158 RepID=A0A6H9YSE6_9ACTN|nr:nucleotide disphospho-sugar-binding domain-containing protein [Actinomadura rudentiformis]KAB2346162.1 DUF1205 domain-containing protein [Actinomadura rudentiformis]